MYVFVFVCCVFSIISNITIKQKWCEFLDKGVLVTIKQHRPVSLLLATYRKLTEDPFSEVIAHIGQKTWRNLVNTGLEVSSLLASFHINQGAVELLGRSWKDVINSVAQVCAIAMATSIA